MLLLTIDEKSLEKPALATHWLNESESLASQYHADAEQVYALYKQEKDKDWPLPIQLKTADTFSLCEDAISLIVEAFCSVDPVFRIKPRRNPQLAQDLEKVVSVLLANSDFRPAFELFIRSGVVLGNGYLKVTPRFDDDYLSIKFEPVDYFNVFPDPLATTIDNARYVIIRRLVHRTELRKIAKTEHHIRNVEKLIALKTGTAELSPDSRQRLAAHQIPIPEQGNLVELLYVYVSTETTPALFIIADRLFEVYSADDPHPYVYGIPMVMFRYIPFMESFFSIGIPHIVQGYQKQMNLLRSARITNLLLALSPVVRATPGLINPEDIDFVPGAFIPAPPDAIEPIAFPDMTGNSHLETRQLFSDMEVATGLLGPARGIPMSKRQTGVEVVRLQQAALRRYDMIIKRLEFEVMRPLAMRIIAYIHEFMPIEQYQEITGNSGEEFYSLPLQAILKTFEFQAVGAQVNNIRELRLQKLIEAFRLLSATPGPLIGSIDFKSLIIEVLKALEIPDPERFFTNSQAPANQNFDFGNLQDLLAQFNQ